MEESKVQIGTEVKIGDRVCNKKVEEIENRRSNKKFYFFLILSLILLLLLVNLVSTLNLQNEISEEIELKKLIVSDYPDLINPEVSDYEKVKMLREWVVQNTPLSKKKSESIDGDADLRLTKLDNPYAKGFNYYAKEAPELYDTFNENKGGVLCAGTSYYLARVYEMFNYDSFIVHTRGPPNWTHAFNIVLIEENDKRLYSLQDAYLNLSYINEDGYPIDYLEFLDLLQQRKHEEIILDGSSNFSRKMIGFDNHSVTIGETNMEAIMDYIIETNYYGFIDFYEENGYPHELIYTNLGVDEVYGYAWHSKEREIFVEKLSIKLERELN